MEASEFLSTVQDVFTTGRRRNLMFQFADEQPVDGKHVTLDGERLLTFGSCSYLGLELDPRLKAGVLEATDRYGTQFSNSRAYVSAGPYRAIEQMLGEILGGHALVAASTTLGHISAIPVLATEKDAIVLDHQVHTSVHIACTLAKANGCHTEIVRHGDNETLEERIEALCRTRQKVWFMLDGVFSMFGDLPDVELLQRLLQRHENLWLYVDDAHGMSIAGEHGRGVHLARMGHHPRQIMAVSLNKAFASAGGCIVFPTAELRDKVRMCAGPLVFGGPVQPPMLGAIQASARLHLSDEIYVLQRELRERIDGFNRMLVERDLPLLAQNEVPIFFLKMGPLNLSWNMSARLRADGLFVNVAPYPAVPLKRSGLRVAITRHHTLEELEHLSDRLHHHLPLALAEEGLSRAEVEELFRGVGSNEGHARRRRQLGKLFELAPEQKGPRATPAPKQLPQGLELQYAQSIASLDQAEWDGLLGGRGVFGARALAAFEQTFQGRAEPENNWQWHYFIVRQEGRPVLATFFTEALSKDDMLMRSEVSKRVEEERQKDPYFLTSHVMQMGCLLTEGNHLFLDRQGPWKEALGWVLDEAGRIQREAGASALIVRDLPEGDAELDAAMLELGLVKCPMLTSYELPLDFASPDEWLAKLGRRTRARVRKEIVDTQPWWEVKVYGSGPGQLQPTAAELERFYELYQNVKRRKMRLNVFDLPRDVFERLLARPGWELVALHLKPEHGGPADGRAVAIGTNFHGGEIYTGLIAGLDYAYTEQFAYRQLLWQVASRAKEQGAQRLALGVDADFEKTRLGAVGHEQCFYVQASEHFGGQILSELATEVSLQQQPAVRKAG